MGAPPANIWTWPVNLGVKKQKPRTPTSRTYILKIRAADCATPGVMTLVTSVGTTAGPTINVREHTDTDAVSHLH